MRVGGHRLFDEQNVREIAKHFGISIDDAVLERSRG
jgi:hypothetical protein